MDKQVEKERLERLMDILPFNLNADLTLLKGHLLIEELLSELLKVGLKHDNPLEINPNNMKFSAKLNMCWFLNRGKLPDSVWIYIKKLNSLRNSMAHEIEPKGIHEKINNFSQSVLIESKWEYGEYNDNHLLPAIVWLDVNLYSLLHKLNRLADTA
ncbi:hypothetical protein [uncultured Shewanella sp.]|uniref:hypothetical protein n=1 Tax=uncultured Shewanella sp. TaxID=173975 RepID=UPI00260B9B49|nr:hypothetical protein [uncultured Shewanella sp.]